MSRDIDNIELRKIQVNKNIFSMYKCDHFEIDTVLEILNKETLPVDIPLNNNQIFIRDLSKYIVENNMQLKPYIDK